MDSLKLTFVNGETVSFPFSQESSLSVETPDGVNGSQRGAWGEIVGVEYVQDMAPQPEPAVVGEPTADPATGDPASAPLPDPSVEPANG